MDVAGDVLESEKSIKNRLLHKQSRKKKRNFIVIPAFVMAVLMIGFALWFIPKQVETKQANNLFENDYLYDYLTAREGVMFSQIEIGEEQRAGGYEALKQLVGTIELAKSKNFTVTEEEIAERKALINKYNGLNEDNGVNEVLNRLLKSANLSLKQYEQFVQPILLEKELYLMKLNAYWLEKHPKMLEAISSSYTEQQAENYMETHLVEEQQAFMEQYNIEPSYQGNTSNTGIVAAIDGDMFYFIQNMTAQELSTLPEDEIVQYRDEMLASWTINDTAIPLHVGDYIKLKIGVAYASEEENQSQVINYGFEILLPATQSNEIEEFTIEEQYLTEWDELLSKVKWSNAYGVTNLSKPYAIVHTPLATYSLFKNDYKNIIITPFGEAKISKVTQGRSEKIEAFLQQTGAK